MKHMKLATAASIAALMGSLAVAKAADLTTLNFNLDGSGIPAAPNEIDAITLTATSQLNEQNRQVSEADLDVTTQNANVSETGAPLSPQVNNNLIFAEGIGNEFESSNFEDGGLDLDLNDLNPAGGDGLIASGQLFAPTSATSSVSTSNARVDVNIDYTSTPVTVEGNRITAAAMGNTADMSMSGDIPSGFTSSDVGSFDLTLSGANSTLEGTATLQLASQQATVGLSNGGTDAIASTRDSRVLLVLDDSAGLSDTVNVNRNQIDSSFLANDANLSINLGDDERSVFVGTLSAASVQNNIGASGLAETTGSRLSVNLAEGATLGAGSIDAGVVNITDNSILATSRGNQSAIDLQGGDNIAMSGGGTTIVRALDDTAGTPIEIDSDITGVTLQNNVNSAFSAKAVDVYQIASLDGIANDGTLDMSRNRIAAQADGNNASTDMGFAGGSFDNSLTASTSQFNSGQGGEVSVTATLGDGADLPRVRAQFVGGTDNIDGSVTLDDNVLVAQARGNVADTSVSLTPAGNVSSPAQAADGASVSSVTFDLANETVGVGSSDTALLTTQENTTNQQTFSATINDGEVAVNGVDAGSTVTGTVSLDNNAILAEARGNTAGSELIIDAGSVGSRNVVGTSQITGGIPGTGGSGAADVIATSNGSLSVRAGLNADATDATLSLDGNLVGAQAIANESANSQSITADTSILSAQQQGYEASATAAGVFTAAGSFAVSNLQIANNTEVSADSSNSEDRVLLDMTGGSLTDSSATLNENTLIAEARANRTSNSVELDAGTSIGGVVVPAGATSAVIQNAQTMLRDGGDSSATATMEDARVQLTGGAGVEDSTIQVNDNLLAAVAEGNGATNSIEANAGTSILSRTSGTFVADAVSGIQPNGDVSASGNFAISNVQAADGDIQATGSDAGVDVELGALTGEANVSASDNALLGQARGNSATNRISLGTTDDDADSVGVAINTTGAITSSQFLTQTGVDDTLSGSMTGSNVSVTSGDVASATLAADGNVIGGLATGNTVTNRIDLAAGTGLERVGATSASADTIADVDASGSFTIASFQAAGLVAGPVSETVTISAAADNNLVNVDFGALTGDGNVSVSGNAILAEARGTRGTNLIGVGDNGDLNAGTSIASTAGIVSDQTTFGDLTSTANDNTLRVDGGALNSGSVAVDNNLVAAQATANSSQNVIDLDAGTGFDLDAGQASAVVSGATNLAPNTTANGASFVIADRQTADGLISATSNNAITEISLDSVGGDGALQVNNNATLAESRGNVASNAISLDASNTVDASEGIASSQAQTGAIDATVDSAATRLIVDNGINSGKAVVDGNAIGSLAVGNTGTNTLLASGGRIALGNGVTAESFTDGVIAATSGTTISSSVADYAITSQQEVVRTGQSSTATTNDSRIELDANGLTESGSLAATNNTVSAEAGLNRQTNTLQLLAGDDANPGTSITSSGAITNLQTGVLENGSNLSAVVDSSSADTGIFLDSGTVTNDASLQVTGNEIYADTAGNVAANRLNAQAGTTLGSTGGVMVAADIYGLVDDTASGDFVVQNRQSLSLTESSLVSSVGGGGANPVISVTTELANGNVALNDNAIRASVDGNDASNVLTMGAGTSLGTSGAVANRQDVTGGSLSASILNPSIELNKTGSTTDGRLSVNGNSIDATASANNALNAMGVTAGTRVNGSSTDATGNNATMTADFAVLNSQRSTAGVGASISGANVSLDNQGSFNGMNTANNNRIVASAFGNQAVNQASLSSAGPNDASVGITNSQYNGGSITASINGASVNASISGGVSRMNGNSIGARAVGNSATSRLSNR